MNISRISLRRSGADEELRLSDLSTGLNLVCGHDTASRLELLELTAHLLLGRSPARESYAECEVEVDTRSGQMRLHRRRDGRLTAAATAAGATEQLTPAQAYRGVPPRILSTVFSTDFARPTDLRNLLSSELAHSFRTLERAHGGKAQVEANRSQLLSQRDQLALEIERRLADRRSQSEKIEREVQRLERRRTEAGATYDGLRSELAQVDRRLEDARASRRFGEIVRIAEREALESEVRDSAQQIEQLDAQILQWRATLADLDQREHILRSQLAQSQTADSSLSGSIADQRACLAVARRLTEDLKGEAARFARAAEGEACLCHDAHPRLRPLVGSLSDQLARLASLVDHQQRTQRAAQLQDEAERLTRSQAELRSQLEHLLNRRQQLWGATRPSLAQVVATDRPSPEGAQFAVAEYEDSERQVSPADTPDARAALERKRGELVEQVREARQVLADLDQQLMEADGARAALLSDPRLKELQLEFDHLQSSISSGRGHAASPSETHINDGSRASDLLVKLTDGRLVGLKLVDGGRRAIVEDSRGKWLDTSQLSQGEQDLVFISLQLATAAGFVRRGVSLPIMLHDPFARLDDVQSRILATVLDDFCRHGRQAIVCTGRSAAIDRALSVGARVLNLDASREAPLASAPPSPAPSAGNTANTLTLDDPIDRFPVRLADRSSVFARSRVRTVGDLVTADPSAVAEELDLPEVTAELVALWQTHLAFVAFVPGLSLDAAQVLTGAGLLDPEDLAAAEERPLRRSVREYLKTERGQRFIERGMLATPQLIHDWLRAAQSAGPDWRAHDAWRPWRRHQEERHDLLQGRLRPSPNVTGEAEPAVVARIKRNGERAPTASKSKRAPLTPRSGIERSPSISEKLAQRLQKAGIRRVRDLLEVDAEALSRKLGKPTISAERITQWSHQAYLACSIPQLRSRDARVLVGCGFTAPEEIAAMSPRDLAAFVDAYAESDEGRAVLRGADAPDAKRVRTWVRWAADALSLDAA